MSEWSQKIAHTVGRLYERVNPAWPEHSVTEGVVATPNGYVVVSIDVNEVTYSAIIDGREYARVESFAPTRQAATRQARRFIDRLVLEART